MNKVLPLILLGFFSFISAEIFGQTICPDPVTIADNDVTPACTICSFPISGATDGYSSGPLPAGNYTGCGGVTIENDQYFIFIVNEPCVSFTVDAYSCTQPQGRSGLQAYIANTTLTDIFVCESNCSFNQVNPAPFTINWCGLIPGEQYYLIIDGCRGAFCDFDITSTGTQGDDFASIQPDPIADQCDPGPLLGLTGYPTVVPNSTGIWTGNVNSSGIIDPTALGPGSYMATYTYTNQYGCVDDAIANFDVIAGVDVTLDPAGPFCDNEAPILLTFTPPTGPNSTWLAPPGVMSPTGYFDPVAAGVGTHKITYRVTLPNGCEDQETINIVVESGTNLTVDPIPDACETAANFFATASPAGGTWVGDLTSAGEISPGTLGAGIYSATYEYDNGNGCINSETVSFEITAPPVVSVDPAGPYCEDDGTEQLTATPPGGDWTGTGVSISGVFDPSIAGPGTHTITYEVNVAGCIGINTVDIDVDPLPTVTIDPAGPVCETASPINLTVNQVGGSWSANAPGGVFDPSTAGVGPHTVTYTYTDGNGCTNIGDVIIDVTPPPVVTITPITDLCTNDPAITATATPTGGTWSGDVTGPGGAIDPLVLGAGGPYTVTYTYTDPNGCIVIENEMFNVNLSPDPQITAAGPFCENDPAVTLTATPAGGAWSGAVSSSTFDPSVLGVGNHSVIYTVTTLGCTEMHQIFIDVLAEPDPQITDPGPLCEDLTTYTLSATPPGGTWGGVANGSGVIDPSALGVGTHTVTYDVNNGSCSETDNLIITIVPLPTPTINSAGPLCENDSPITLTASPSGGIWAPNNSFDPSVGPGTYNITYTYTDANGCEGMDDIDIVVNAAPDPQITPVSPICETAPAITLTATPAGGTWSANAPGGVFDPSAAGAGPHIVTYTVTNTDGCTEMDDITITVTSPPVVTVAPISDLCTEDSPITAIGSPPGGTWTGDVTGPGGAIDPFVLGAGGPYMITYTFIDAGGCQGMATETFNVNLSPDPQITAAGPFCENDPAVTLTATPAGGVWSGAVTNSTFDPSALGVGNHSVIYTVTTPEGCTEMHQIFIDVSAEPDPQITDPGPLCENLTIYTLSATPPGGTWGGVANSSGEIDPSTLGVGTHTVTYEVTNVNCSETDNLIITIAPLPTPTINSAGPLCENDSPITLTASPSGGIWAPNNSFDPSVGPGTYNITYTYTDANGCEGMDDIDIVVNAAPDPQITPELPICETEPAITLTATPSGGTWSANASGGVFDPGTAGAGPHLVTYTVTNTDGCTEMDDITITVTSPPVVTVDPISDLCTEDIPINAVGSPPGGTWTGDVTGAGGVIDPFILGAGGPYMVTYTFIDAGGCQGMATETFNVNLSPDPFIDAQADLCENDPAVTLIATPAGGVWSGAVTNSTFDPSVVGVGNHSVIYTVTSPEGCTEFYERFIEVFGAPNPQIDNPGNLCVDDGITTLTATPSGGVWGGDANSSGQIDPTNPSPQTVTYEYTNADGCSEIDQLIINISPLPNVQIDAYTPVCENASYTTLTATPAGGNWSGDVDINGGFDPDILGAGSYLATYEYTDGNGCSNDDDILFEILPAPAPSIDAVNPLCETSNPEQLVGLPSGGTWSGTGVSASGLFDPSIGKGNYTITYSYTNAGGCTEVATILIVVDEEPIITYLSDDEYCTGAGVIILDADPFGGEWGGAADIFGAFDVDALGVGQHDVTYTYEAFAGCEATITQTITIRSGTVISFANTGPFCEDDPTATLTATPNGGVWGGASFGGSFSPSTLGPGIHDVTYTYTNATGCVTDTIAEIEVFETPDASIDPTDEFCPEGAVTQLTADPPNGTWGGVANSLGEIDPVALGDGTFQVTYSYTNADGCSDSDTETIEVLEAPDFLFLNTGPFCLENQIHTLDVDPFGGEWGGDVNFLGEFNPTDLGVGIFTATYLYEYGVDCEAEASTPFEIIAGGNITFGDSVFCQNTGMVTLTADPMGGSWSGSIVSTTGQVNTNIAVGIYTVTYSVNSSGNCEITEDLTVEIQGITAAITGPSTFCQTEGMQVYNGTPSGGAWGGVANTLGEVDPSTLTIGMHDITYTATSTTGCINTSTTTINVTAPPTAVISGDETICPTGNTSADLTIILTGTAPWEVEYTIDAVPQVAITINSSPYLLNATQAGAYELTTVSDNSNCSNTASGTATITELLPLTISNISTQCDGTNTGYVVSFEITGGAPTYVVTGITGTISSAAPYIFTSQTIGSGMMVNFTVSDNSSCAAVTETLSVDCSCETTVGEMDISAIDICGTAMTTATYDNTNEVLDADDLVQFVLHTNSGVSLGTIISTNGTPSFDFAPPMLFGTTYYISAIAGSNDGSGNVDLTDDCLQVAAGTPVTWRENPTASISGGAAICAGEEATLLINLTGQSPWTIQYSDGTNTIDLNGITNNPFELKVNPSTTTTYTLTTVSTNFCSGTVTGMETVTVNDAPMMSTPTTQCDATFSNYVVSFNITGGDAATYMVTGIAGSITNGVFTSDPIMSGTTYQISLSDGNGCPPVMFSDNVDCGCLTAVGEMDNGLLRICGDGPVAANYDNQLEMLDADDIVRFVLHTSPTNTIGNIIAWNDVPEFSFDPNTMTYGTTYYISAVAGNDAGGGTIDLSDNCTDISLGTPVEFRVAPTAAINGDAAICAGETAQLTITLTGTAPWAVVYNDGANDRNITLTDAISTIDVTPTATTIYTLVSVRDGNCVGTISGIATVTIEEAPDVDNVMTVCNLDKTEYTVTFDIIGGDVASYSVTGNTGTLNNGMFTSDPIPTGTGYSFTITDVNDCDPITITANNVLCDCETEAGSLQNMPQEVCVGETVEVFHNNDDFLDANDVLMFALHDGSPNRLGNILVLSNDRTFSFDGATMMAGVPYYISAIAGNTDPNGINLNDPCLSVSAGVGVVFNALPTVLMTADPAICLGEEAVITFQLTGERPFSVEFSDGMMLDNISDGYEYKVNISSTTAFEIVEVIDGNGCRSTTPVALTIMVNEPASATVIPANVCNTNDNNNVTTLDFSTLITGGDATGSWVDLDGSGATGSFPNLEFENIAPGQYRFEYTTAAAQLPCTNVSYIITIDVSDCACPSVATAPAGPFCNDDIRLELSTITATSEPGMWSIANAPSGSTASISNNIFVATGSEVGDYVLTFTLSQTPPAGCPMSSSQTISIVAPPSADVTPTAQVCNTSQSGAATTFDFSTLITGGDATGSWAGLDGSGAVGSFPNLEFENIAPGQYRFEYTTATAQTPCTNATYIVTLNVSDCACPSVATAPAGPFCNDDAIVNLSDITITTEAGSWSITSAPTGSTANINSGRFDATDSPAGDYELTFTLNSPIPGCPSSSSQTINIVAPPSADVTPTAQVCNTSQSGAATTFDFATLITGGDATGNWVDLNGSGATGSFPILEFENIAPGQYRFEYTTASAQMPCANTSYIITIDVSDCACPSVATAPAGPFCNDDATVNLSDITITTEPGTWSITDAPNGSIATISNGRFDATNSVAGDYELTFTLNAPIAGCPAFSTQMIAISEAVSAGTGPGVMRICNDGTPINLFDELTGATAGGTWTDRSVSGVSGFSNGILNTQNLAAGTYVFDYEVTTDAPCVNDIEQITIEIEDPVDAGNLIRNVSLCEGIDTTISLFDLIENYDAGGVWTDISTNPIGSLSNNSFATNNLQVGAYQFEYALTTTGICPSDRVVAEVRMSPTPDAEAGDGDELNCDDRIANIGGQSTTGSTIVYQWTGSTTIDNPQAANTTVRSAGVYTLRVTDSASGCFAEDEVTITEQGSLPTLSADPIEITCFGDNNGIIRVNGVSGGNPPYLYSLNGSPFSTDNRFENLTPGDYTLEVEDSEGCKDMLTFTIEEPDELTVTLTTNLGANSNLIQQGDSLQLNANVTGVFDSIQWSPIDAFEPCDPETDPEACLTPWVAPTEITTYEVFVVSEKGCSDRSSVTVYVQKDLNVYIPDAFTPNDDGINDIFRIFTDENVEKVKSFLVFDRWGEKVHEYYDFQPNEPAAGWDGRLRGERMNSAVFAYFAIIEFRDGTEKLYEGDVTLLK